MSKIFWAILGGIGLLIMADSTLGELYSRKTEVSAATFHDFKQMAKPNGEIDDQGLKNLRPQSEVGKALLPYLRKTREIALAFSEQLKKVRLVHVLDWSNMDTPEARAATLHRIDLCQDAWRAYYSKVWQNRKDMLKAFEGYNVKAAEAKFADFDAEEGRLLRLRFALYDGYRALVAQAGKAKLKEEGGKVSFVEEAEWKAFKKSAGDCIRQANDFDRRWKAVEESRKEGIADSYDKMASQVRGF